MSASLALARLRSVSGMMATMESPVAGVERALVFHAMIDRIGDDDTVGWPRPQGRGSMSDKHGGNVKDESISRATSRYGEIFFPARDRIVGRSVALYGEYVEFEVALFRSLVGPEAVALDIGANIGCHTLGLASMAGRVIAFEPQPRIFQLLQDNLAINRVRHVEAYRAAVGATPGRVRLADVDLTRSANFGLFELEDQATGVETDIMTIDALDLPRCDFIKCDVEGMETEVLLGARRTIERRRPSLYLENDRPAQAARLTALVLSLGYRIWWHTPTYFNPDNLNRDPVDVFHGLRALNLLCLHADAAAAHADLFKGLVEIKRPSSAWPPIILRR